MKVAMVIGAAEGADWFPPICAGLGGLGHDVQAVISDRPGDLGSRLDAVGVPWHAAALSLRRPLATTSPVGPLRYAGDAAVLGSGVVDLARQLRRLRVDAVVTNFLNAVVPTRLAAVAARIPVRLSMAASPFHLEAPALRAIDRATVRLDTGVIAGSERIRDLYRGLGVADRRLNVVYYGADAQRFDPTGADGDAARRSLGVAPGAQLVGQVAHFYAPIDGRVAPTTARGRGPKGHEVFLHAAQRILEARPDVRFVLAGDARGPAARAYLGEVRDLAERLGVSDAVVFCGPRDDVPDLLMALDVSVQASLVENLGGTIESLLMARPTVATRVGGMPESVRHEDTGLLVAPDDPAALATAILRLLDDGELANRLGTRGRELMLERFTMEHTIGALDRVLREARGRPVRPTPPRRA